MEEHKNTPSNTTTHTGGNKAQKKISKWPYTERQEWFADRIEKRVYRNKTSCGCAVCTRIYENGLIIADRDHASYLAEIEAVYNHEGSPLGYFDTKEEALEYEKNLKP